MHSWPSRQPPQTTTTLSSVALMDTWRSPRSKVNRKCTPAYQGSEPPWRSPGADLRQARPLDRYRQEGLVPGFGSIDLEATAPLANGLHAQVEHTAIACNHAGLCTLRKTGAIRGVYGAIPGPEV